MTIKQEAQVEMEYFMDEEQISEMKKYLNPQQCILFCRKYLEGNTWEDLGLWNGAYKVKQLRKAVKKNKRFFDDLKGLFW